MTPTRTGHSHNFPWPVHERISTRAKRIRVEVRRDGAVWLVIPQTTARQAAYAFLATRSDWISRTRQHALSAQPRLPIARPAWDGSGRMPLAGIQRGLRRQDSRIDRVRVRLSGSEDGDHQADIVVFAPPQASPTQLETALACTLREHARTVATRLLADEGARLHVSYRGPRIADQRSRWGSCAASGLISLNWRLVMAPPAVLRYVIVHELCHRVHANHSARFWRLLARQQPDYAAHKAWLREHGDGLHAFLARPRADS